MFGASKYGITTMRQPGFNSLGGVAAGLGILSGVNNLFGGGGSGGQQSAQMADPYGSQRGQWAAPLKQAMTTQPYNPYQSYLLTLLAPEPSPYMQGLQNFMVNQGLINPSGSPTSTSFDKTAAITGAGTYKGPWDTGSSSGTKGNTPSSSGGDSGGSSTTDKFQDMYFNKQLDQTNRGEGKDYDVVGILNQMKNVGYSKDQASAALGSKNLGKLINNVWK